MDLSGRLRRLYKLGLVAGSRGGAALAELAFTILVARQLDLMEAGHFFVALTVVLLAAQASRAGIDFAVTRILAQHLARSEPHRCAPDAALALVAATIVSSLVCALLYLAVVSGLGQALLGGAGDVLLLLLWASVPVAITYVTAEALKGLDRQILSQVATGTVTYLVAAVLVWIAQPADAVALAGLFGMASLGGMLVGLVLLALALRPLGRPHWGEVALEQLWSLLRQGLVLSPYRPLTLAANWMPILLLNTLSGAAAAGVYAVANRLAVAISLIGIAVEAIYAPRFARAAVTPGPAMPLAREACLFAGAATLPFGAALALLSGWLLGILNPDYAAQAGLVLVLLCLAYSVNAFLAPLGTFGAMMGRARLLNLTALAALAIAAVGGYALIPVWGAEGCALVLLVVFAVRGAMLYRFQRGS
ncbi:hypothetical protein [Devosia sp. XK-2]|uniref:lipopolysaccharide biosynthesis protein n=1 Tax=Devosia sp. XK-2 TaxID=3126689 RepID=UPI0030CD799E